jgi:hypothetical protein
MAGGMIWASEEPTRASDKEGRRADYVISRGLPYTATACRIHGEKQSTTTSLDDFPRASETVWDVPIHGPELGPAKKLGLGSYIAV